MPVNYTVVRSAGRRSLTLKVRGGEVYVYAPVLVSQSAIDRFVTSHQNWINRQLTKVRHNINFDLEKDDHVYLLGERYDLEVITGTANAIILEADRIILKGRSYSSITRNFRQYLCDIISEHVNDLKNQWNRDFTFSYRFYRSRWGCCYREKRHIVLNYLLGCVPFDCIDEVICHEMAHLKVANHQAAFYEELSRLYPDYRKAVKRLKSYTVE